MTVKSLHLAAAAAAAGLLFAVPAAQASGPTTPEARAKQAAAKGPEHLRRFIERTRMIYGLSFRDFAGSDR